MQRKFFKITFFAVSLLALTGISGFANAEFDAAAKYAQSCGVCHNSGVAGAPKKGDANAWAPRLKKGEDALLASVKNGIGAMPAKGMCMDCSDEQFKALIQHMSK